MKSIALSLLALAFLGVSCGKKNNAAGDPASLEELNRVVATMVMHQGGKLPGTNDIAKFLETTGKTFPQPPPGKKLFLNPATQHFEFTSP